eukprot:scaffold5500_cov248-Pinguiococcus_pyrenoidosus.AAC.6
MRVTVHRPEQVEDRSLLSGELQVARGSACELKDVLVLSVEKLEHQQIQGRRRGGRLHERSRDAHAVQEVASVHVLAPAPRRFADLDEMGAVGHLVNVRSTSFDERDEESLLAVFIRQKQSPGRCSKEVAERRVWPFAVHEVAGVVQAVQPAQSYTSVRRGALNSFLQERQMQTRQLEKERSIGSSSGASWHGEKAASRPLSPAQHVRQVLHADDRLRVAAERCAISRAQRILEPLDPNL